MDISSASGTVSGGPNREAGLVRIFRDVVELQGGALPQRLGLGLHRRDVEAADEELEVPQPQRGRGCRLAEGGAVILTDSDSKIAV